jgi:cytidine deaminase
LRESDRGRPDRWPQGERRSGKERRTTGERRAAKGATAAGNAPGHDDRRIGARRTVAERRDETGWTPLAIEDAVAAGFAAEQVLLAAAVGAREFAQAPYSKFKVGAALETIDGTIVTGCNIENATYGLTLCAERVALVKALSEGHTAFARIAVAADSDAPTPPCGPCRQLLWEYCGDVDVILGNRRAVTGMHRLSALLPLPFDNRLLSE